MLNLIYQIIAFTILTRTIIANKCNREPDGYGANKTPADGRYHIRILEPSIRYTPGTTYTISIEGIEVSLRYATRPKFTGFVLVVEKKTNLTDNQDYSSMSYGVFSLIPSDMFSKITCGNMVTHTTTTQKNDIKVLWTAPQSGSGCVIFRATVIEHRDIWYMDDGPLSKEFCEEEEQINEFESMQVKKCCACTEAKYEMSFQGLWLRNTHPKDFPSNSWLTRFSDIIGATHSGDYRLWQYGGIASDGLRQLAEVGATKPLEQELKKDVSNIRTFIKARGLSYPNITDRTFSIFRVDPNNHLVSFVSMINPSPDWFVGVSGLELCLSDCSWIGNKVLELYPWDAGTDSGATYISADQPTTPQDPIRRIKPDYPNDPRSPFYDPDKDYMLPLAKLYLTRQREYEKECSNGKGKTEENPDAQNKVEDEGDDNGLIVNDENINEIKLVSPKIDSHKVNKVDTPKRKPQNDLHKLPQTEVEQQPTSKDPMCELTDWSGWSECSVQCGTGKIYNSRRYVHGLKAKKICNGSNYHPPLILSKSCEMDLCGGDISKIKPTTEPRRTRKPKRPHKKPIQESTTVAAGEVTDNVTEIPEFCSEKPVAGNCENSTQTFYYDKELDTCAAMSLCEQQKNSFATKEECYDQCHPKRKKNESTTGRSKDKTTTAKSGWFSWMG